MQVVPVEQEQARGDRQARKPPPVRGAIKTADEAAAAAAAAAQRMGRRPKVDETAQADYEIEEEFAKEFWPLYPEQIYQKQARTAYYNARRKALRSDILDGVRRYIASLRPDSPRQAPHRWLEEERWTDNPTPASSLRRRSSDPLVAAMADDLALMEAEQSIRTIDLSAIEENGT